MTEYTGPRRFSSPPTAQELERLVEELVSALDRFGRGGPRRFDLPLGMVRTGSTALGFGRAVRIDTSGGDTVRAVLPIPDSRFGGLTAGLVRMSSSGTITVVPAEDATIDGSTTLTLPTDLGVYEFLFDGRHWRRFR